jgi:hypothetical protein
MAKKETTVNASNADALIVLKALERDANIPLKKLIAIARITTSEEFDRAAELLKDAKIYGAFAEAKEKSLTAPLNNVVSDIRAMFKPFREYVKSIEGSTKMLMMDFIEQTKAKEQKLLADFESGKIKNVSTLVTKTKGLEIHSSYAQVRKRWVAVCVDEAKTPRAYMVPDAVAIADALKAGKTVAGWEWKQVDNIAI